MNNQQEKTLLPQQKRQLKSHAHHLKPVVMIGKKGITPGLIKEIDEALGAHELIKLDVAPKIKEIFLEELPTILHEIDAYFVDAIGNIVIIFRPDKTESRFDMDFAPPPEDE